MPDLTVAARAAFAFAAHEVEKLGSSEIDVEHLLLGLLKVVDLGREELAGFGEKGLRSIQEEVEAFAKALEAGGLEAKLARRRLRALWKEAHPANEEFSGHRSPHCRRVFAEAEDLAGGAIGLASLTRAVLSTSSELVERLLSELKVDRDGLLSALAARGGAESETVVAGAKAPKRAAPSPPERPLADFASRYGRDLTRLAREGKLQVAIGRDEEIKRVARILLQAKKANPILVGDAGVGKTAIVEGLAIKLVSSQVRAGLEGLRIVELSVGALVAGTKHRGDFEGRLQEIIRVGEKDDSLVFFIDEVHMLLGAGSGGGAMDAANLLKPALSRGVLRVIGATTTGEYRKHIEKDPALERRFQPVWVDEPSRNTAVLILEGLRPTLESHHGVRITPAALERAVDLAIRYLPDFRLPDKAIDLLDQACARSLLSTFSPREVPQPGSPVAPREIGAHEISAVVADRCRVPAEQLAVPEGARLLQMEQDLGRRVIGQETAVKLVADAIRTARVGLKNPRRPLGVFLFLGPTGTGKTELAKALAEFLFGDEKRLIRIDMSEYAEKHAVARLIGSPPGYVGHEEGGQLTDAIRTHPYSVVLFDEIEKAHPDTFGLFLQIFDEGQLMDSRGRRATFSEAVVIMTSNLGVEPQAEAARQPMGFLPAVADSERQTVVVADVPARRAERERCHREAVAKALRPELLNRIQHMVFFHALNEDAVRRIIDKLVAQLREGLRERNVDLRLDDSAYAVMMSAGFSPEFGAREMERAVERLLAQPLARGILEGRFKEGSMIHVMGDGEQLVLQAA